MAETTEQQRATGNGRVAKAAPAFTEIGTSGLDVSSGRPRDEFHRNLRGDRAIRTWREMSDNDPVVGSILFAIEMLLRRITWRVEPSERTEDDARATEVAEFGWSALNDMSTPWDQVVGAIVTFLPYGFSFLEQVYKIRGGSTEDSTRRSAYDDGLIGWRKWALRSQDSLVEWKLDRDGGLEAYVQRTNRPGQSTVAIPIEKGLLFRTTSARGNPEGRSVLRNAYRPWFFKKRIEEIEGIGIERDLAGLPVAKVPAAYLDVDASPAQKQMVGKVAEIVRDIRRDDQEGVIFPSDRDENGNALFELELLTTGGRRQFDTDAIVGRYDQRIAMTVLADFILLGHENVGSFALGASKTDLFKAALTAFADEVCSVVNQYAFPRLMLLNGLDPVLSPILGYEPLDLPTLAEIGEFLDKYAGAGGILDRPLEDHLRDRAGFPPSEQEPAEL